MKSNDITDLIFIHITFKDNDFIHYFWCACEFYVIDKKRGLLFIFNASNCEFFNSFLQISLKDIKYFTINGLEIKL